MTPLQITILAVAGAALVALGIYAFISSRMIRWPQGPRATRSTSLGHTVIVINAPFTGDEQLQLIDACATSTVSLFTAWRSWRIGDAGGETVFPTIAINFISDETMDAYVEFRHPGQNIAAYLDHVSSSVERLPLIVIRESKASLVVNDGQPVIHELLHEMLSHFMPEAQGNNDHTHIVWGLVQGVAVDTFKTLYSPEGKLRRRSGPPKSAAS